MREKEKWYKFVTTNWKIKELSKHFAKVKLFAKCFVWHHFYTHKKRRTKSARSLCEWKKNNCLRWECGCLPIYCSVFKQQPFQLDCLCVFVFFFSRRKCLPLKIITKRKEFSFTWLNIKRIEASHVYQKV